MKRNALNLDFMLIPRSLKSIAESRVKKHSKNEDKFYLLFGLACQHENLHIVDYSHNLLKVLDSFLLWSSACAKNEAVWMKRKYFKVQVKLLKQFVQTYSQTASWRSL